jgi:hypothetical protein
MPVNAWSEKKPVSRGYGLPDICCCHAVLMAITPTSTMPGGSRYFRGTSRLPTVFASGRFGAQAGVAGDVAAQIAARHGRGDLMSTRIFLRRGLNRGAVRLAVPVAWSVLGVGGDSSQ